MTVHLVNPSHLSFGVGVITPRWLFVLAAATPAALRPAAHHRRNPGTVRLDSVQPATSSASGSNGQRAARLRDRHAARARGATVVFGGIHATLYPDEAHELGGAHAVVTRRRRRGLAAGARHMRAQGTLQPTI